MTISSPEQLMAEIVQMPEVRRRYAERWVTYATKRQPNASDACIVDTLAARLSDDAYPIRNVLLDLSQVESFRLRTPGQ
jgi:hypothetical protein